MKQEISVKLWEALLELQEIDISPIFKGIWQMNHILEQKAIPHPMDANTLLSTGRLIGLVDRIGHLIETDK